MQLRVAEVWPAQIYQIKKCIYPVHPLIYGAPSRSRTCDPPLRRRMLYPAELPGLGPDCNRSG